MVPAPNGIVPIWTQPNTQIFKISYNPSSRRFAKTLYLCQAYHQNVIKSARSELFYSIRKCPYLSE